MVRPTVEAETSMPYSDRNNSAIASFPRSGCFKRISRIIATMCGAVSGARTRFGRRDSSSSVRMSLASKRSAHRKNVERAIPKCRHARLTLQSCSSAYANHFRRCTAPSLNSNSFARLSRRRTSRRWMVHECIEIFLCVVRARTRRTLSIVSLLTKFVQCRTDVSDLQLSKADISHTYSTPSYVAHLSELYVIARCKTASCI